MKLYKLTNKKDRTRGATQWGPGINHVASGEGPLCSEGWLHAYTDPILAVLLNPIHADFKAYHLWECSGEVGKTDNGLKVGCTSLTTLRRIRVPRVSARQRLAFAILCVMKVTTDRRWRRWASRWLSGKDRTAEAAYAAAYAAREAAYEDDAAANAAYAAAHAAHEAAYAAAYAAREAAYEDDAAAYEDDAAANAAYAAAHAAHEAAYAAAYAARAAAYEDDAAANAAYAAAHAAHAAAHAAAYAARAAHAAAAFGLQPHLDLAGIARKAVGKRW